MDHGNYRDYDHCDRFGKNSTEKEKENATKEKVTNNFQNGL
jgi:hypothetical protein